MKESKWRSPKPDSDFVRKSFKFSRFTRLSRTEFSISPLVACLSRGLSEVNSLASTFSFLETTFIRFSMPSLISSDLADDTSTESCISLILFNFVLMASIASDEELILPFSSPKVSANPSEILPSNSEIIFLVLSSTCSIIGFFCSILFFERF